MNFEEAYLQELYNPDLEAGKLLYKFERAKQELKNILKLKYGKIVDKLIPELVFQIEEQGNKVLELKHRESGAKIYAIVPYEYYRDVRREVKRIGFGVRRV